MGSAIVTLKLSPEELQLVTYSLEWYTESLRMEATIEYPSNRSSEPRVPRTYGGTPIVNDKTRAIRNAVRLREEIGVG